MIEIEEKGLGYRAFQCLPDILDRVVLRTVWWQKDQTDVESGCTSGYGFRMMDRTIVQDHQYRQIRTAFAAHVLQERAHVLCFRGRRKRNHWSAAVYRIETECIRPQFIRVILTFRFFWGPEADGVGDSLRR